MVRFGVRFQVVSLVVSALVGATAGRSLYRAHPGDELSSAGVPFRLGIRETGPRRKGAAAFFRLGVGRPGTLRVAVVLPRPASGPFLLRAEGPCGRAAVRPGWSIDLQHWVGVFDLPLGCEPSSYELLRAGTGKVVSRAQAESLRVLARGRVWDVRRQWTDAAEWLYSAWIAALFREPRRTWRPLGQVVEDPARNFLYGVLGLREDRGPGSRGGVHLVGDCADVPYSLRAYFAWKLGLAFRFRECDRGSPRHGPRCQRVWDNLTFPARGKGPAARFQDFVIHGVVWKVHSGTLRTVPEDVDADVFPVRISRRTLVPGVLYVDPGGHVLVAVAVDSRGMVAVDGHPDLSVTVRRLSRSRFKAFPYYERLQTGGFKAFRPLVVVDGRVRVVGNGSLRGRFSVEQYALGSAERFRDFVLLRLETGHVG